MVFGVYCHRVWLVIKESWWGSHSEELVWLVKTVVLRFAPLWELSESPDAGLPHRTTDFLIQLFRGGTRDSASFPYSQVMLVLLVLRPQSACQCLQIGVCKLFLEIVTVAGFVSHALSVTATQLCLGRAEIAASNLSMKGCKLCSNKTLLTKPQALVCRSLV